MPSDTHRAAEQNVEQTPQGPSPNGETQDPPVSHTRPDKGVFSTPAKIRRLIEAARQTPDFKREPIPDDQQPGLFLVIGKRTASWTLKYRPRGHNPDGSRPAPSVVVLGDAAELSVDEARAEAGALRARIAKGANPARERACDRARTAHDQDAARSEARRRAEMLASILDPDAGASTLLDFSVLADASLAQCVVAFDLHGSRGNPRTRAEARANLNLAIKEMDAKDIKAADLKQARVSGLDRLHASRPATGRHRIGALNRLYKWLMSIEAASANPAANVPLPSPPAPRTRVLSAAQVKLLWKGADELPEARRDYLRLVLLLPLRRQELADTRRRDIHINGDRMEIIIASSRSKNGREHRLPLVGDVRSIVERLLAKSGDPDDFMLDLTQNQTPMNSWRRFAEAIERAAGFHFEFHDARRLFASEAGEHDLADFPLIDACLNHAQASSKTGAARAYHHARHANALANLMAAWGALVRHALDHGRWPREEPHAANVVSLDFGAGK